MPYETFSKMIKGMKKFCMTSKDSGKTYCYKSMADRKEGMRMHEAFKSGFKMTNKK